MNPEELKAEIFDVFLCHNGADKRFVAEIAQKLSKENIKPWLDKADIRSGVFWDTAIGQQIETVKSAVVFVGQHGIGPWQHREIIALLDQFDRRGCPVIPVILPSEPPTPVVLPWSLASLHCVDFRTDSLPLQRLVWGITGQKPSELADLPYSDKPATIRDASKFGLIPTRDERAPSDKAVLAPRLYPPLAEAPDRDNTTQLNILRKRVGEYWVDGVLKHSLYNEVLISLGKREMGQAVDAPWKYTVEVAGATDVTPLDDRDVSAIYDATGLLLILGEPGSGKTTTLLDLARILLERAIEDIKERVAVVLNLSSWKRKVPIEEWISNELSEKYRVPRKIGRFWLQRGYLLPLLDGLDEVETVVQPDCVTAINEFIEEFQPSGLVVCCRLNEYRWLPKRLKLNGAICIEPLSPEEVSKYLIAGGPNLATLRQAVAGDPVIQELAQTPLMLSIMGLAYQGVESGGLARQKGDSPEERRTQILRLYVYKMFQLKGTNSLGFPKEKIISWLSWLAQKMQQQSQSVFLIEGLQPSWLGTRFLAYTTVVGLGHGLTVGLLFGLLSYLTGQFNPVIVTVAGTILGGLNNALEVGSIKPIALVEAMSWKWDQFWRKVISGSLFGAAGGIFVAVISMGSVRDDRLLFGLFASISGLILGLVVGVVRGFIAGFSNRAHSGKTFPNQGIKLSLQNFLITFLITFLIFGFFIFTFGFLIFIWNGVGIPNGLLFGGLGWALVGGLIVALNRGGSAVIKHYALRLILCLRGYTPFNLIKFLDRCSRLIFLEKVGGGYIFIHRMLLDYFADLPQPTKGRNGNAKSIPRG